MDAAAAIRAAGGAPILSLVLGQHPQGYPDMVGHDSWSETYADRRFWAWLFAQRRGRSVDL